MQSSHRHPIQNAAGWGLLTLAIPLLWWGSSSGRHLNIEMPVFMLFHTAIEILTIVVALLVFVTSYRAIFSARKAAIVILGVSFLGVGMLDYLHTMACADIPDITTVNCLQKSTFFWISARLLGACALMLYAVMPDGLQVSVWKKSLAVGAMIAAAALIGMLGMRLPKNLPMLFSDEVGQGSIKLGLEFLIICLNLTTLFVLWKRRQTLAYECVMALGFAAGFGAISELFFAMQGVVVTDDANVLAHLYKLAAFLFLFHATFNEALRRPIERMQAQYQREAVTLSAAPDGVLWVNETGHIVMTNPAIESLTGYRSDELTGQHVNIFLPAHLRERHTQAMQNYFRSPHPRAMGLMDLNLMRSDGQLVHVDISLGHWEDEGARHSIAYIRDLSERKKFEESLRHKATHDDLTGLPNRWLFRLQLDQALARAVRTKQRVAVLFLDLDYFKNVNDSFGHDVGDALLVQVGARIRKILREHDTLARQGGDEFAILLTDLVEVEEAVAVATKILATL
ncbi:MAG: diguanylate cyclase, partial [Burkholderiaceae bacterium]|nr:diguanylate cyclase [Burkholderiaceae bacterium]